MAEERYL